MDTSGTVARASQIAPLTLLLIVAYSSRFGKGRRDGAFEAELQSAINPKGFLPEHRQLSILMG